jgi:nondiscriminating aspartyl-tRNA synthetase
MNENKKTAEKIKASILELLKKNQLHFSHLVHSEATATKSSSAATGFDPSRGIKSLIIRGKKSSKNYLVCILGHQRIDMKALSLIVNEPCEFEKLEKIKEKYGLEIGGIPPFGSLLGIETYFDESILRQGYICNRALYRISFNEPP